jgi:hypothetical protein
MAKCPGAETLLRAVIDNDEGVSGAIRREKWLAGQDIAYLLELGDSLTVLTAIVARVLEGRRARV